VNANIHARYASLIYNHDTMPDYPLFPGSASVGSSLPRAPLTPAEFQADIDRNGELIYHVEMEGDWSENAGKILQKGWLQDNSPSSPKFCTAFEGQTEVDQALPQNAKGCRNLLRYDYAYCADHGREILGVEARPSEAMADNWLIIPACVGSNDGKLCNKQSVESSLCPKHYISMYGEKSSVLELATGQLVEKGKKKFWKLKSPVTGMGLYCVDKKKLTKNGLIYPGEKMSKDETASHYDSKNTDGIKTNPTIPYALTFPDGSTINAAQKRRGFAALINDHRKLYREDVKPRPYASNMIADPDRHGYLKVSDTRGPINNKEIFMVYSEAYPADGYWSGIGYKYLYFATLPVASEADFMVEFKKIVTAQRESKYIGIGDGRTGNGNRLKSNNKM